MVRYTSKKTGKKADSESGGDSESSVSSGSTEDVGSQVEVSSPSEDPSDDCEESESDTDQGQLEFQAFGVKQARDLASQ